MRRAQDACARSDKERRRVVAELRRGGETQDQPRNHPVPNGIVAMNLRVRGLRWHGPDHASRGAPVVGAPNRSDGYGLVAPTHAVARVPRIWGRGIPGTRAVARVATRCTSSSAFRPPRRFSRKKLGAPGAAPRRRRCAARGPTLADPWSSVYRTPVTRRPATRVRGSPGRSPAGRLATL